jgi:hypothetical protein
LTLEEKTEFTEAVVSQAAAAATIGLQRLFFSFPVRSET